MIGQLNVEFDPNAIRALNEICHCNPIEGIADISDAPDKYIFSFNINSRY
jgi:hypothetical protein